MDWIYKAGLTAVVVALLLVAAQWFGRRLAGILTGLPTVTGPALIWLAIEHGNAFAVQAALGSVAASALCGLFALGYQRASRRFGPIAALVAGLLASALTVPLIEGWLSFSGSPVLLLTGAIALCALCVAGIPATRPTADDCARPAMRRSVELAITAIVSGAVTGLTAAAAPDVGPFWAGVLASPPLIAAVLAIHMQLTVRQGVEDAVARFLRGYAAGLIGRSGFAALFALLLTPADLITAASVATITGCMATMATAQLLRSFEQRPVLARLPHGRHG